MAKTSPKTRNRKPQSYRFNATERERIKDNLRPALKSFITSMKATDIVHDRALPYLGGDWRLQDECDDRHNIPFPLWIDVDFREVKRAVDVLFPDEAADLKQNILDYIERRKREKRRRDRQRDRFFDMVNLMRSIWSRFGAGWIAGQALFNILTPDAESRARWEKHLRGRKIESFRVPASTAAIVVSELLDEEFKLKVSAAALKKMFEKEPRP